MIKFHQLCVLILCVCLGQTCADSDKVKNERKKLIREQIFGVGEQFVDDWTSIAEKNRNNSFIIETFQDAIYMLSVRIPKENNSKIDVRQVKDFYSTNDFGECGESTAMRVDYLRIFQSILSKQFPPERYNGVVNVIFATAYDYATTDDIQSVLNYLYGVDTAATKISFLDAHNISNLTSDDCPKQHEQYMSKIDELTLLVDVRPKVMQDFLAVREQFPCNLLVLQSLGDFIQLIQQFSGDKAKINACMIIERFWQHSSYKKDSMKRDLEGSESILSTRLPDETIRGIINFKGANIADTPIHEIEEALKYLYEDVPKAECPTTVTSTLKAE